MVPNLNHNKHQVASSLSLFTSSTSTTNKKNKDSHPPAPTSNNNKDPGSSQSTTKLWSAIPSSSAFGDDVQRNGIPSSSPNEAFKRKILPSSIANLQGHTNTFLSSNAAGAIGPTALLVGGTAALYQSLLNHPSSTLTPLSVVYMLLLAIQTSIQPRLSKKYIPKRVSKVKVALVEEVIKTSVAGIIFYKLSPQTVIREALKDWTISSSLLVAGLPATLYALQGVLTYLSHQHLDSVTFNGLSQTKTLTAALCCYVVMGKRQSPLQIVALAMLFVSAFVFQKHHAPMHALNRFGIKLGWGDNTNNDIIATATATSTSSVMGTSTLSPSSPSPSTTAPRLFDRETEEEKKEDEIMYQTTAKQEEDDEKRGGDPTTTITINHHQEQEAAAVATAEIAAADTDRSFLLYGVLPCLGATFLSGLAGAFSQRGLQIVGGSGRNAFLYTVEVSFFSALTLFISEGITSILRNKNKTSSGTATTHQSVVSQKEEIKNSDPTTITTATKKDDNFVVTDSRGDGVVAAASSHEIEDGGGWPWQTYIPITCKAMGGILTALVHKHAGSVVKGFALMLGLVMSGILQSLWLDSSTNPNEVVGDDENNSKNNKGQQQQQSRLAMHQVAGIVIVMFSSWLHFTNPPS